MAPSSSKGKEKVIDDGKGSGKRKRGFKENDKSGGVKRRNRQALQFFEDAAYEVGDDENDDSDDSFFNNGFLEDEFDTGYKFQKEPSKAPFMPFVLKEEEPTEEELEKLLQERYKPGSSFVTYAEDNYESKKSIDIDEGWPSIKEPTIWKVKCVVGRERHSAFCLMQKYVDLKYLGNKLQIISAFSVDHIKGFIYVEADTQQHIYEACNGLSNIYSTRVATVPRDDVSHLFTIRSMGTNISEGMWARVKNGKYKGDLAQVAAVNDARKKVTVKLVPRIDMQALAEKNCASNNTSLACDVTVSCLQQAIMTFKDVDEFTKKLAEMILPVLLILPKTQKVNCKALELVKEVKWPLFGNLVSLSGPEKKLDLEHISSVNFKNISKLAEDFHKHCVKLMPWLLECSNTNQMSKTLCFFILLQSSMVLKPGFVQFSSSYGASFQMLQCEWEMLELVGSISNAGESNLRTLDGDYRTFLKRLLHTSGNELNAKILICLCWRLVEGFIATAPEKDKNKMWHITGEDP